MKKLLLILSLFSLKAKADFLTWKDSPFMFQPKTETSFGYIYNPWGTTYYVSTTGSNGNNGLATGTAWADLVYACAHVTTGDIIHLIAGTYTQGATVSLPLGVSIEGDGVTSVINASFSTANTPIIDASSATRNSNGNQHISFVKLDGQNSTQWCMTITYRGNFSIHDCTFTNFVQRGVIFAGFDFFADLVLVYTHTYDHYIPNGSAVYATGNSFYNNSMTNCAQHDGTYAYGSLEIGGQSGMLIHDNTILCNTRADGLNGEPIKLWAEGCIKDSRIYNNILKTKPFHLFSPDNVHFDFAIELFYVQGLEVDHNTVEGSIDLNWQVVNGSAYSTYIHDNTIGWSSFTNGHQSGVLLEFDTYNAQVLNNKFYRVAEGVVFSARSNCYIQNVTIKNNLMYEMGLISSATSTYGYGVADYPGNTGINVDTLDVEFNTIVGAVASNLPITQGIYMEGLDTVRKIIVKNNIIMNTTELSLILQDHTLIALSNFTYNDYYGNTFNDAFLDWTGYISVPGGNTVGSNLYLNPSFTGLYIPTGTVLTGASDGTAMGYSGGNFNTNRPITVKMPIRFRNY